MKILVVGLLLCLFPGLVIAQNGSPGMQQTVNIQQSTFGVHGTQSFGHVGSGCVGTRLATINRTHFEYRPVTVMQQVAVTTQETVAVQEVVLVEARRVKTTTRRPPWIAFPRRQLRIANRTARTHEATSVALGLREY